MRSRDGSQISQSTLSSLCSFAGDLAASAMERDFSWWILIGVPPELPPGIAQRSPNDSPYGNSS